MHREIANGRIVILENYLGPSEFTVTDPQVKVVHVKEGTWPQGPGYRDPAIWTMVKRGALSGLSVGGSASSGFPTGQTEPNSNSRHSTEPARGRDPE